MATSIKRFVAGSQLTTSAATYYTATNVSARVDSCALTNTTGGAVTATLHVVPSGGSATASNCIMSAKSIAAGATFVPPGIIGQVIENGGTLQALASAATSISLVASGIEYAA